MINALPWNHVVAITSLDDSKGCGDPCQARKGHVSDVSENNALCTALGAETSASEKRQWCLVLLKAYLASE